MGERIPHWTPGTQAEGRCSACGRQAGPCYEDAGEERSQTETHGGAGKGGPWVPSAGYDEKSRAASAQAGAERTAWLKGWEEGLAQKIATGRVNPHRGTEKNAYHHNFSANCTFCEEEKCA